MELAVVFMEVINSQDFNPNDIGCSEDEDCINALAKMDESEYIVTEIKIDTTIECSGEIMERINWFDDDVEAEEAAYIVEEYKEVLDSIGVTDYDRFLKTHWCAAFGFSKEVLLDKVNKARV
jgi:hypothetical protein